MSSSNGSIPDYVMEKAEKKFKDMTQGSFFWNHEVDSGVIAWEIPDPHTGTAYVFSGDVKGREFSCVSRRSLYPPGFNLKRPEREPVPVVIPDIGACAAEKTYVYSILKSAVESFAVVWGKFSSESLGLFGKQVHVKGAAERMVAKGKEIPEADNGGMMEENSDTGAAFAGEKCRAVSREFVWSMPERPTLLEAARGEIEEEISEADIRDYDVEAGLAPENPCWGEGLDQELDWFDNKKPVWSVWGKIRASKLEGFCFSKLAEMSISISGQAILTLTGNAASTGSDHSGEFKIIALANGFGFTSALISMIYKNKYSAVLGKLGVICTSFGLIASMAVLLDVEKVWMWGITGVLTLIPAIAVSLA